VLAGVDVAILFRFGQEAVITFFLLSGFVIDYSFQNSRTKTFGHYFSRRFYRIYIPLLIIYPLSYLLASLKAGVWVDPRWQELGMNLLQLQDLSALKPGTLAEPYLDNAPLWTLAYEWWFYMLYYPIAKYMKSEKMIGLGVYVMSILAAVVYLYDPGFLSRHLMYFSIWWCGITLSWMYRNGEKINLLTLWRPLGAMGIIAAMFVFEVVRWKKEGTLRSFGFHPMLELRHFASAFMILAGAVIWRKLRWFGFDLLLKPFAHVAPMTYLIYIGHYPLMLRTDYLDFIPIPWLKWTGYVVVLLLFSWFVEVHVYPWIRQRLQSLFSKAKFSKARENKAA
jgi:peptidoglycan/LPS O-acetylase OafA/YrhL